MKPLRTHCLAGSVLLAFVLLISGCGEPPPEPETAAPAQEMPAPAPAAPSVPELQVTNGMPESAVVEALGKPSGVMESGGRKMLLYAGGHLEISEGCVANLDPAFNRTVQAARESAAQKAEFEEKQRAKGLVSYDGKWMKPRAKEKLVAQRRKLEEAEQQRQKALDAMYRSVALRDQNGNPIDHSRLLTRGHITIVDFYADWCAPCRKLAPHLAEFVRSEPAVSLKKVNIGNWGSPTARNYNVRSVPNLRVFDRKGRLMGPPTSSLQKVRQYVEAAKQRR